MLNIAAVAIGLLVAGCSTGYEMRQDQVSAILQRDAANSCRFGIIDPRAPEKGIQQHGVLEGCDEYKGRKSRISGTP